MTSQSTFIRLGRRRIAALGLALVALGMTDGLRAAAPGVRPNVLFLAIDDLRNELGSLGVTHARTPHLDSLAAAGRLFTHHYVQVPTCGASRCSLLSGRYPSQPVHVSNNAIRATHPEWGSRSLPAWFRQHGYRTLAVGKIGHYPGGLTGRGWAEGPEELPGAWDRIWIPDSPWQTAEAMMHGYANGKPRTPGQTPPFEAGDGPDELYPDAWVARDAVATLRELAPSRQPWFFAVGFFKPHLPFAAPRRWFDLHAESEVPSPAVTARPPEPSGWHASGELKRNYRAPDGRDPDTDPEYAALLRRAYSAATSYMDAQLGRVLAALRELRLEENTIVVAWSDHGFLLGEHAIWGKHCLYDIALRSPLIVRHPGLPRPGEESHALVETVDIFPTLLDLCGLPRPEGLDGRSLSPQLADPRAGSGKPAHGFWTAGQRTIRTDQWRLIVHPSKAGGESGGLELFDLRADPNEARNVAAETPRVVQELLAQLERVPDHFANEPVQSNAVKKASSRNRD
jgi:iduronate 2-sulfatase